MRVANSPPKGLPTTFPRITIFPNGDPSYPDPPDPTTKPTSRPTSSACKSSAVASCTKTIVKITEKFDGASSSSVTTSTVTNCRTITQCSGTPTTVLTTTATTITSIPQCSPGGACSGASCNAAREISDVSRDRMKYSKRAANGTIDYMAWARELVEQEKNGTLSARDVRGPGVGSWDLFYSMLAKDPATGVLDLYSQFGGTNTAVDEVRLYGPQVNGLVQGLYGCTSIIAVTNLGKEISVPGPSLLVSPPRLVIVQCRRLDLVI